MTGLQYDPGISKTMEYDKQLYCRSTIQYNGNMGTRRRCWYQHVELVLGGTGNRLVWTAPGISPRERSVL